MTGLFSDRGNRTERRERIFSFPLLVYKYAINPMVARKMKRPWVSDAVPPHRTFYEICVIKWFIDIISPHNDMKQHFYSLLEQYPNVDYKAIGIPRNWLNEPLW